MFESWTSIVAVVAVALGALAELNLLRLFVPLLWNHRHKACSNAPPPRVHMPVWSGPAPRRLVRSRRLVAASLAATGIGQVATASPALPVGGERAAALQSLSLALDRPDTTGLDARPQHSFAVFDTRAAAAALLAAADEAESPPLIISTDRPSFSDTTGIEPVGHLNLETGSTFTFRNRDDVETQRHNAPEILARVGLIEDRLEVRALWSGYVWSRTDDGSGDGFTSSEGFTDMALGFKFKTLDQDGWVPRLALEAITTLGVGSDNISSQIAEPTLKLLWSYDLAQALGDSWKNMTLGGNANVAFPTTNGDRFTQGQASVYFTFSPLERTSVFIEYFALAPNTKGSDAAHYIDFGGTYLLTDRVQLDARLGVGLNDEADNLFVGAGVSVLF